MNIRKLRWLIGAYIHRHRFLTSSILLTLIILAVAGKVLFTTGFVLGSISAFQDYTYAEGIVGQPQTLNPLLARTDSELDLSGLLFRSLTKTDLSGNTTGDLAESWEINPLGQLYLFHLKKDQRFQNGDLITADDIAFTYQLVQDPKYNTKFQGTFSNLDIEVVDQNTILFKLKEPFSPFLSLTNIGILPKNATLRQLNRGIDFSRLNLQNLGSTDFKLQSVSTDGVMFTKADKIFRFKFYKTQADLQTALKLGEVRAGGFDSAVDLSAWKKYQVISSPLYQRYVAVFYNTRKAPLDDKFVRQSLSLGIDKVGIIDKALGGAAELAYSSIPPVSWAKSTTLKKYDYSAPQASTELDKAGWKIDHNARVKDAKPLEITLSFQNIAPYPEIANIVAENWAALGIKTTLDPLNTTQFDSQVVQHKNYQAALFAQEVGVDPDQYVLWHTTKVNDTNITGISAPKLDKSMEDGRISVTRNDRITKYLDFQRFLLDESPVSFLYYPKYSFIVSDSIQGTSLNPLGLPKDRYADIGSWKVIGSLF